jgi:hypothetical protein
MALVPDGRAVPNGVNLVVLSDDNLITRRSVRCTAILPQLPVNGGFARLGRNAMVYTIPFVASDGRLYKQTQKVEMAFHPEYAQADKEAIVTDMPNFLADADFLSFWHDALLS